MYESENDDIFIDMLNDSQSDVVIMGHTHLSFKKYFDGKWAINAGSVGRSREGNRLASYVILTLDEDKITPEVIQLSYPIEEVAQKIEESEIPNYYASFLRNEKLSVF